MSTLINFFPPVTPQILIVDVVAYENETRPVTWPAFTDVSGNPLALATANLQIDVFLNTGISQTLYFSYSSPTNFVANNEGVVTVTFQSANLTIPATYSYQLWDSSTSIILAQGKFDLFPSIGS